MTLRHSSLDAVYALRSAVAAAALVFAAAHCGTAAEPSSSSESPPVSGPVAPVVGSGGPTASGNAAQPGAPATPSTPANVHTDLYVHAFGRPTDRPVVYLHGGPGSNSYMFEASVAQVLADRGNFVVTFDQRGCGRSPKGTPQDYNYAKATQDLDDVIHTLHLASPILIGHSWGGTLALKYLELHPGGAKGALLVGTPIVFPDVYFTVLQRAPIMFQSFGQYDKASALVALRAKMFPNGLNGPFQYSAGDIGAVMQSAGESRLEFTPTPTPGAVALWASIAVGPNGALMQQMNTEVGDGFQANEHVGYLDFSPKLTQFGARLYAIYGDQDGLFSAAQLQKIASSLPAGHFTMVSGASHFSFVDQAPTWIDRAQVALDAISAIP